MVSCSVLSCDTTQRNNPNKHTFHKFPVNQEVKEKWIRLLNQIGWEPQNNSVVCSKHFKQNCFIQRNRRRILKKQSIPTEDVPVNIKPGRPVSSYVYRDILPAPSTSQPKNNPLTPRIRKLTDKCSKLKQNIKKKQQNIKNLRAKTKRLQEKVSQANEVIEKLNIMYETVPRVVSE